MEHCARLKNNNHCGGASGDKMAAMKRAWMNIERNIYAKHQLRLASGAVLGRLKKLVGISEVETNVAVRYA